MKSFLKSQCWKKKKKSSWKARREPFKVKKWEFKANESPCRFNVDLVHGNEWPLLPHLGLGLTSGNRHGHREWLMWGNSRCWMVLTYLIPHFEEIGCGNVRLWNGSCAGPLSLCPCSKARAVEMNPFVLVLSISALAAHWHKLDGTISDIPAVNVAAGR